MRTTNTGLALISALVALAGCAADTNNPDSAAISRDEARAAHGLGGKADHFDICERNGWYGDGICDEFCLEPDYDCDAPCMTDRDCPQPVCVQADCPTATCNLGECVIDAPTDNCLIGQRECELCEGESTCVPFGQGCPEIACFDDRCEPGQRACQTCGDAFVCTAAGSSCPLVDCGGECGIFAKPCPTCEGDNVCVPNTQECPMLECPPPGMDRCAEGQRECVTCGDTTLCVDEQSSCPLVHCPQCEPGQHECETCEGEMVCVEDGTMCPDLMEACMPPMGMCTDTCRYAGDGECDDGGPGSDYSVCEYGTDCQDCGHRQ